MRFVLAAACALSLAACAAGTTGEVSTAPSGGTPVSAGATASVGAVNPVGAFDFETQVNGQPTTGTVEIAGSPGAYTGRVVTSATPDMPIRSVTVNGQEMTVMADTPDGAVTIRMTFTGDSFTGNWALGPSGGALSGRRTR